MARTSHLERKCFNEACPSALERTREFYIRPNGNPHSRCVQCHRNLCRERYHQIREERRKQQKGYYDLNIERFRERDRERYASRRERQKEYIREWRKSNRPRVNALEQKREAMIRGASFGYTLDRGYVYDRDGGKCHICGLHVDRKEMTLDHLIPVSRGGPNTHENVRVAHRSCNSTMAVCRLPAQLLLIA